MKKFISIMIALALTTALSISAFAAAETQDPQQAVGNSIVMDAATDAKVAASEAKDDTVFRSDVKSFKGKLTGLFVQLNKLREECKDLWTKIKASNQSIKTAWADLRSSLKDKDKAEIKQILTDIRANIEPLRTKVKALHSDIKTLRTQKSAEWVNLKAARKEKDEAKATAALNNIISLKSQIIEKQKELLPLKQQILDTIK